MPMGRRVVRGYELIYLRNQTLFDYINKYNKNITKIIIIL